MVRQRSESGYILVTVAALLFALVGFTALAVDMGTVLSSRTQIQRAADAAALAGAFTFNVNPSLTDQPTRASNQALKTATANTVMGIAITDAEVTITVVLPDASINKPAQVTVTIQRTEPTVFAKILDVSGVADKVTAAAEAGTQGTGARCVKPFFIPNTALSSKDPCAAEAAGEVILSSNQVTTYASNLISSGSNQMRVKPADPHQALAPGDYYEIDIDGGGGGAYTDNISHCNTTQLVCRNSYDVLTGNKMGPTIQGVRDLIGQPPTDSYISVGQYQTLTGISDTSRALAIAPVWDILTADISPWGVGGFCPPPSGTCTDPNPNKNCRKFPGGSNVTVQIIGFAIVFVESVNGGEVRARLINVLPCGPNPPPGEDAGPFGVPIRLVRK